MPSMFKQTMDTEIKKAIENKWINTIEELEDYIFELSNEFQISARNYLTIQKKYIERYKNELET
jgi:regulator of PEP synthase PpsR (kinase-PPPase family)